MTTATSPTATAGDKTAQRKRRPRSYVSIRPAIGATERRILAAVCDHYDVTPAQIAGDTRDRPICRARAMLCFCLGEWSGVAQTRLGPFIGRDRTSIIHHHGRVYARLEHDAGLRDDYMAVLAKLAIGGPVRRLA